MRDELKPIDLMEAVLLIPFVCIATVVFMASCVLAAAESAFRLITRRSGP